MNKVKCNNSCCKFEACIHKAPHDKTTQCEARSVIIGDITLRRGRDCNCKTVTTSKVAALVAGA